LGKFLVYHLDDVHFALCASLPIKPVELAALAARDAATLHPEKYGNIADPEQHRANILDLKRKLAARLNELLTGYDLKEDVLYLTNDLSPQQVAEGQTRMVFKVAPGISPNTAGWPLALVQYVASKPVTHVSGRIEEALQHGAGFRPDPNSPTIVRRRPPPDRGGVEA
jgi:hypothetical protein